MLGNPVQLPGVKQSKQIGMRCLIYQKGSISGSCADSGRKSVQPQVTQSVAVTGTPASSRRASNSLTRMIQTQTTDLKSSSRTRHIQQSKTTTSKTAKSHIMLHLNLHTISTSQALPRPALHAFTTRFPPSPRHFTLAPCTL